MDMKTIKVGDETYNVNPYPATKGLKLLARLTKLCGLPLAHLFGGGSKANALEVLPLAVTALTDRMEEDEVVQTIKDVLSTTIQGSVAVSESFDTHFQGRYGHLFKVVSEVIQFQYSDFLDVAVAVGIKEMARSQSQSQKN